MAAPVTFNLQTFGSAPNQYSTEAALEAGVQAFGDKIFDEAIKNGGKTFVSRAAAVSAGQDALPSSLGQVTTREGDYLVLRSPTATADDPLFSTSPQWGVVSRLPVKGLVDRLGIVTLAGIGGTADAITATADATAASGMRYLLTPAVENAGPVTLSINGGAALSVRDPSGTQLTAGMLKAGVPHILLQTSSSMARVLSPSLWGYKGLLTAADLNKVLAPGDYVLSGGITNGPAAFTSTGGLLSVVAAADFVLQVLSTTTDGTRNFQRRIRVSTADIRPWAEWRSADDTAPALSGVDLNTVVTAGKAVLVDGFTNGPTDYPGQSGLIETKAFNSFLEQTLRTTTETDGYWWRKLRPQTGTYYPWAKYRAATGGVVDPSRPLAGKRIVFMGDSITENYTWPSLIGDRSGAIVTKGGFGGTRLTEMTGSLAGMCGVDIADAIQSGEWGPMEAAAAARVVDVPSDDNRPGVATLKAVNWNLVDAIVCFWGTNDWANGVSIGNPADMNRATIYGGVNYFMSKVLAAYPHLQIVWITPMFRARISPGDGQDSDNFTNPVGERLVDLGDAIRARAQDFWHVPALDLYRTSGISLANYRAFLSDQTIDGLHPREVRGNERVRDRIEAFLRSVL